MAKAGITIRVKFNDLPKIEDGIAGEVADIIDKFLTDVDADATVHAPVLTGHLKNARERDAESVHWFADYAGYVNGGTRYMAANPFVTNAVNRALPGTNEAITAYAGSLGR